MQRASKAGGFFISAAILVGFVIGILIQNPMSGIVWGTLAGVAIAVVLWLIDRRGAP